MNICTGATPLPHKVPGKLDRYGCRATAPGRDTCALNIFQVVRAGLSRTPRRRVKNYANALLRYSPFPCSAISAKKTSVFLLLFDDCMLFRNVPTVGGRLS